MIQYLAVNPNTYQSIAQHLSWLRLAVCSWMEFSLGGMVKVIFRSGISRLDKRPFTALFNCVNQDHLKWLTFYKREALKPNLSKAEGTMSVYPALTQLWRLVFAFVQTEVIVLPVLWSSLIITHGDDEYGFDFFYFFFSSWGCNTNHSFL